MSAYDITGILRTVYRPFAYCVPLKHPLNTAYQKGGVSPLSMLRAHVQSFLQTLNLVCLLMFMLINAEMTPKRHERSDRAKILDCFTLYVTFAVVFDENWNKKNI